MGTTFITLSHEMTGTEPGFWVNESMLELWLRLLALHLPDPRYHDNPQLVTALRDHWLGCGACVSHGMEDASATPEGRAVIREAIDALLPGLKYISTPLDAGTLNLLRTGTLFGVPIERRWLVDIGHAFIDLLDGKITRPLPATEVMPGSKPYHRA